MLSDKERIERLEELYEDEYHKSELLYNEIVRLIGIMNKLNKFLWGQRDYHGMALKVLSKELDAYNKELLEHFQSHYLDKKKRIEYASKRNANRYNKYTP